MNRHLMVTADYPPRAGGQARYLHDLWGHLSSGEATILAPLIPGMAGQDPGNLVRVSIPLGGSGFDRIRRVLGMVFHTFRLAVRLRPVAIHAGQVLASGTAGLFCRLVLGIPFTVVVHGADLLEFSDRFLTGRLVRKILGMATKVIVNSRFTAEVVLSHGVPLSRVRVVNPVVDPSRFSHPKMSAIIRARFGLENRKVMLTVGRLVERKGHDTVIRAMRSILDHVPDAHYLIAGDGPYKDTLQKMARDLGVQDRVTFAGFVPDDELPEWYCATDLFVMISREITARGDVEGFGIVYLEASAAGQAIVAGDSGGVPDAVEEGMGGILVPPNDAVALAATLSRVLGDTELRRSMASAGRRRVQDRFTPDRGHGEMLEVMHEVARAG